MSKKNNRNRNHSHTRQAQPAVPSPSPAIAGAAPVQQPPRSPLLKWVIGANGIAALALVVSVGSMWYTMRQAHVAQETLDRTTGKKSAQIEYADFYPLPEAFRPDQRIQTHFTPKPRGYFKDTNSLVLLAPTMYLNNAGTDSIDAVKVAVGFLSGIIDTDPNAKVDVQNPPTDWYKSETPVILRRVEREEHVMPQQWKPGQCLKLPVLKGFLGQLAQVQSKTKADVPHIALLEIAVYARLTGSTAYTGNEVKIEYLATWMPKGFPDDECKRVMTEYQPKFEFGPPIKPRLPTYPKDMSTGKLFEKAPNYAFPQK